MNDVLFLLYYFYGCVDIICIVGIFLKLFVRKESVKKIVVKL